MYTFIKTLMVKIDVYTRGKTKMNVCNYCIHHPYCHGKEWCANFTDDKNEAERIMEQELLSKLTIVAPHKDGIINKGSGDKSGR